MTIVVKLIGKIFHDVINWIIEEDEHYKGTVKSSKIFNFEHCGDHYELFTQSEVHRVYRMTFDQFFNLRNLKTK